MLGDTSFDLVIHNVETPDRRERYLRELPTSNRTDGVLLVSLPPRSDDLERLAGGPVPLVVIDVRGPSADGLPVVRGDDVAGGALAGRYLFALGHRSIGFVSDSFENPYGFTSSRDRYDGIHRRPARAGRRGRSRARRAWFANARANWRLRLLTGRRPPTAIFAASDTQALGVMSAARDLGPAGPGRPHRHRLRRHPDRRADRPHDDHASTSSSPAASARSSCSPRSSTARPFRPSCRLEPELVIRATSAPPKEGRA